MSNNRNQRAQEFADQFKRAKQVQNEKLGNAGIQNNELLNAAPAIAMGIGGIGAGVDAFTGEANPFNSGEGLVNVSMGLGTFGAAAAGASIGTQMADLSEEDSNKQIRNVRDQASKDLRSGNINQEEYTTRVNKAKNRYERRDVKVNNPFGGEPLNLKEPSANMMQGGRRGAAIGAAAALVPALLSMRDQETLANQSASLM